jgi:putative oxidoreductase
MEHAIELLLRTNADNVTAVLRIVSGIIIWPYGMQKLLGWFDGMGIKVGIKGTLEEMAEKKIPKAIAWLIIIGQSFGSIALIVGFLGRLAAGGLFIIFTGALINHLPNGWTMNWFGKKNGEGIEYHVLLMALLLAVIINGSGAMSADLWLTTKI